ncbi:hypothetical protein F5Y17DRAFT_444667 [Xylariaceae sp. FL0594]|nr:hypothetical protein F5Y17DRAFT_444667 [Xylariaceae sp. FL0594]
MASIRPKARNTWPYACICPLRIHLGLFHCFLLYCIDLACSEPLTLLQKPFTSHRSGSARAVGTAPREGRISMLYCHNMNMVLAFRYCVGNK